MIKENMLQRISSDRSNVLQFKNYFRSSAMSDDSKLSEFFIRTIKKSFTKKKIITLLVFTLRPVYYRKAWLSGYYIILYIQCIDRGVLATDAPVKLIPTCKFIPLYPSWANLQ